MTVAELPAPLTKGKRWAKNAAEREQQIHSEAVAIKVRRPELFADLLQSKTPACQRGFRFCSFDHFSDLCSGKPRESCNYTSHQGASHRTFRLHAEHVSW